MGVLRSKARPVVNRAFFDIFFTRVGCVSYSGLHYEGDVGGGTILWGDDGGRGCGGWLIGGALGLRFEVLGS